MPTDFVHLNVHSEYSLVDGLVHIKPAMKRVAELGMSAIAITDISNFFAAIKFYKAARANGIKPIFGAELWVKVPTLKHHVKLTVLCQNNIGYDNLTQLLSRAYLELERDEGIPLIPFDWFTHDNCQGLIALSGGHSGEIGYALIHQGEADVVLQRYLKLFDNNRFYLEVSRTDQPYDVVHNQAVFKLAQAQKLPVIANQKVCFVAEEDFEAHEVRVAIRNGYTMEDPNRPKPYTAKQYLASPEDMAERFHDYPQVLDNTIALAKRCNVTFVLDRPCLPNFPTPNGQSESEYLAQLSREGLDARFELINLPEDNKAEYRDRLQLELDVIINMGFPGYFLIVADFIHWSKNNGVPVGPGRGSGAGSLVAYALNITDVDPIPYDLLFERFLNPERVSMPDFDVDFCMKGRDRVIEYVAQKYGRDSVSQIVTFGSMAAKAVIRDVGRVMGHPYGFVDAIAKLIPMDLGMTLTLAMEQEETLKARYDTEEEVQTLMDMALKLEGTVRNVGKHAGGVVIAPSKLSDFCAVYCEEGSVAQVSQFDKDDVESAGLVKFDFLGLRNLTIIAGALAHVNKTRKQDGEEDLLIESIPLDDKATFSLLKRCETTAIFQLESRGMKDLVKRLQPDCFEEIVALVALFRPGPLQSGMVDDFVNRKHGRAKVEYPHPDTVDILKPTYGIILYQEQVMKLAQVLALYTLGAADMLRRAMGKKKPEEMAKQRKIFIEGAHRNNIDNKTATYIFDLMEKFAGYGFNKSHSAAYAMVSYQTAYLKSHYPAEFMASVLSSDMDNTEKMVAFVDEAKQMKLNVLGPDINKSDYEFMPFEGKTIRYGLGAIKGVGESAIESILEERTHGPFEDLFSFCERVDLRKVNRRVLEALIGCGAFDSSGYAREVMLKNVNPALKAADQKAQNALCGQSDLFGMSDENPTIKQEYADAPPMPEYDRLLLEKNCLGFFLSGHPMHAYQDQLVQWRVKPLHKILPTPKGRNIRIAGVVTGLRRIRTKRGNRMLIATLDDSTAAMDITLFSEMAFEYQAVVKVDRMLVCEVGVSKDDFSGGFRISPQEIWPLGEAQLAFAHKVTLRITPENQSKLGELKTLLADHHSEQGLPLILDYHTTTHQSSLHYGTLVARDAGLLSSLKALLSDDAVEVS
jgi:DNA polymerase-3 subunit alpha